MLTDINMAIINKGPIGKRLNSSSCVQLVNYMYIYGRRMIYKKGFVTSKSRCLFPNNSGYKSKDHFILFDRVLYQA